MSNIEPLSPAQEAAYAGIESLWGLGNVLTLWGSPGYGKSTVAKRLASTHSAKILTLQQYIERLGKEHPLKMEDALFQMVVDSFQDSNAIVVEDIDIIDSVIGSCSSYPRAGLIEATLTALCSLVSGTDKKLLFTASRPPRCLYERSWPFGIGDYDANDCAFFLQRLLSPKQFEGIDVSKVFRYAPYLSARQLTAAATFMATQNEVDTNSLIEYLRSQHMSSNVDLGEVRPAAFEDLHGVEEVIEKLEANIIMPLECDELAAELDLRPKRGVLLVGPPGTGKTTIGRALAHRLKSKFFLIDGTIISGTSQFYGTIQHIFGAAKENAPSIIFIDDTDAIFESGEELGLYRYLLTMLDGLESESQGHVCVMMTAMDVAHLPPALIRSGRIELWLEMRLPDESARWRILDKRCGKLPEHIRPKSLNGVVAETEGFTGADLVRLVDDAKTLLAYDRSKNLECNSFEFYLLKAVEGVRSNKMKYAEAEASARQNEAAHRSPFDFAAMMPPMSVITQLSSGGDNFA